ncbi:hypothetical protein VNO80_10794 [Phaseolus coccineus]|uniref:RRM domain-containing protein n=1 Tax=Phaseolus coccineus TaxID=3886 RepID=A0AAN9REY0_PHACN
MVISLVNFVLEVTGLFGLPELWSLKFTILVKFKMSDAEEYRCFIGGLAWSTSDRKLKDTFEKFGKLVEAKVVVDKFSGRSRGFGFVTFDEKKAMEEAIDAMNGMDLDGRTITVEGAEDLMVVNALSVENLVILLGNVLVKGPGVESMVVGKVDMVEAVVVVTMVQIEMQIALQGGAAGMVVVMEILEMIDITVIVQDHMSESDGDQEAFVDIIQSFKEL